MSEDMAPTWREQAILRWLIGAGHTSGVSTQTIATYYERIRPSPLGDLGRSVAYGRMGTATKMFRRFEAKGWIRNGEITRAGKRAANE